MNVLSHAGRPDLPRRAAEESIKRVQYRGSIEGLLQCKAARGCQKGVFNTYTYLIVIVQLETLEGVVESLGALAGDAVSFYGIRPKQVEQPGTGGISPLLSRGTGTQGLQAKDHGTDRPARKNHGASEDIVRPVVLRLQDVKPLLVSTPCFLRLNLVGDKLVGSHGAFGDFADQMSFAIL